jgi:hypothetical protein
MIFWLWLVFFSFKMAPLEMRISGPSSHNYSSPTWSLQDDIFRKSLPPSVAEMTPWIFAWNFFKLM